MIELFILISFILFPLIFSLPFFLGGTELDNQKLHSCMVYCKKRVNSIRNLLKNAFSS